jgi:NADPH:quinone reductase-like Zn-dependent oxidoreductase
MSTMQAAVRERYGPDHLEVREIPRPEPAADQVLVRVRASSVNRADWYTLNGRPWFSRAFTGLAKPKSQQLGADFAGIVDEVGRDAAGFAPGDEVFGVRTGAYAEYVAAAVVEPKPARLSFEEAATLPIAGLTALRDHGAVREGTRVLVNGASGGVGTFAVQVAKALGATVTAVCSTRHLDLVAELGADRVIDYTREDFTLTGERYDVLFDNAGNRSWRACRRVLTPNGTVVLVGGPMTKRFLGPVGHLVRLKLQSTVSRRRTPFFIASSNRADLATLRELVESGRLNPVVECRFELAELGDAMQFMGEGHAHGKIAIAVP